ncbi:hypothetical protein FIU88_09435 [Halomonas sp. THAF12]|uniref:hypothetical protein n=1 Tax=Halomonas sp. THAF12 TaxID=2587849 RepID=UPI0012A870C3|nr:hypothetical protein [Halomonas sp. THAF12]QFT85197.1 hypothetical protein FIU88_09435 [Halomonas sp. THAF12]
MSQPARSGVSPIPLAPAGDPAFFPLYDERMRWPIRRAQIQVSVRSSIHERLALPLERLLLRRWSDEKAGSVVVERHGLPQHAVEEALDDHLTLQVDPRALIQSTDWRGYDRRLRPSSSRFLWDGDWDLRRGNLRFSSRYRFVSDLDEHRHDLTQSTAFARYAGYLTAGKPWSSHQQGVLLDSEARILMYLRVYLSFLDDMAVRGFDASRGKDALGVAVSREGRLIKINRGLHRLAMAQRLGLPTVPVRVKAVHRDWWRRVTDGVGGRKALVRVSRALQECIPEQEAGSLDPATYPESITWPEYCAHRAAAR